MKTAADALEALVRNLQADSNPRLIDVARGRTYTGAELATMMTRSSRRLLAARLMPGDTVLFVVRPSANAIAYLSALITIGCRTVLTDLRLPSELVRTQLDRASLDAVITEPLIAAVARNPIRRLMANRATVPPIHALAPRVVTTRPRRGSDRQVAAPDPGAQALIVFTSGTTASPKGVVHTQSSLGAMFATLVELMREDSQAVVYSDQFHSIVPGLAAGATCVVGPPSLSDQEIAKVITEHRVDNWFTTPTRARSVIGLLGDRHPLRVILGSAPVNATLVTDLIAAHPGLSVTGVYAMTEVVPVATTDGAAIVSHRGQGDLVGRVVDGIELMIDDDGEVLIRGPRVGHYLDAAPGWIATGDLGYLDQDGQLVLNGRCKDMILCGGRNIYPQHFEPAIDAIVGVSESAMVGVPDAHDDEEIWLVVDAISSQDRIVRALQDFATREGLDVKGVVFAQLPRGHQAKLDRTACRALVLRARVDGTSATFARS